MDAETYRYERRNWYPHMGTEDATIWERCINKYPELFTAVQYDIKVGTPPEFDTVVNPETGGNAIALYKKKIDVVGYKGLSVYIVEVKKRATFGSVGQVKGYADLYQRELNPREIVTPMIVTDNINPDAEAFAKKEGVMVLVV